MLFGYSLEALRPYAVNAVRVALILALAWVAARVVNRLIRRLRVEIVKIMELRAEEEREPLEKRAATIGAVLRETAVVLIWVAAVIMALDQLGFDIGPLLAGAGIAGVAIGFGAQSLVKDVINGMFLLIENQIRVGDVAQLNGTGGLVEEINLRTTVLRGLDGTVHIFPNGTIQTLSNLTRTFSYYVFNVGVAYKEDTDRVVEVLRQLGTEAQADPELGPMILEPIEILGVDQFADSAVIIKARIKTRPIRQWTVGREMNRRIKKKFDELGIEIPFPHVSLYTGEASKPLKIDLPTREELKALVREVLAEAKEGQDHA